jgi:uncharacterized tellurite resistance protein B-like protein
MAKNTNKDYNNSFLGLLALLANADGSFDEDEKQFIHTMAEEWEISDEDVEKVISHPENVKLRIPDDIEERNKELAALIGMMTADGTISDEEFQFCVKIAEKFNIDPDVVNTIVSDILSHE